ncbi:unnamed protein product [Malus baccata var. baccata]
MDFVYGLPRTPSRYDGIWVIVDRLTKTAHFLPVRQTYSLEKLAKLFVDNIVRLHGVPVSIVTAYHPQTDGQSERTIQTLEDMLRVSVLQWKGSWDNYLPLVEFAYNNSYHSSIGMAPFEALYGKACRTPLCWTELSPWKGVVRFGKRGKLSPRYVGPYQIIERIGAVAYRLELPPELSQIHNVFHVSMLRKYVSDPSHIIQIEPLEVNPDVSYVEEPVAIIDRQDKVLRNKVIHLVKVLWRNHAIEEATWETEESMQNQYPFLFRYL